MFDPNQYVSDGLRAGCPPGQMENFIRAGIILQPRQLAASAAARLCDQPDGPSAIGYGGARGGGKSHWLLAQMGADDCQRVPGLKCLLLRKSGKANLENFEDLRLRLFPGLNHTFNASRGILTFENGSRILAKHYQHEKEIDAFLGLEYDVIGIEEATILTWRKYQDITTCCRSSKQFPAPKLENSQLSTLNSQLQYWRPRLYSTTNPGGVGHEWYRRTFIVPHQRGTESATRFIPARVDDNQFTNPEYKSVLASRTGWQKDAWYHGRWDIAAGQFFNTFRHDAHVVCDPPTLNSQLSTLNCFDESRAVEWCAAMDYGYTHYTVVLLGCFDRDHNLFIVDEHAERLWVPQRHVLAIRAMLQRHRLALSPSSSSSSFSSSSSSSFSPLNSQPSTLNHQRSLARFVAGGDLFARQCDGTTIADHFSHFGLSLRPANTNRVQGWLAILQRLGDPDAGIKPSLFIHQRCTRLLDCLPFLQHDPDQPADVLKTNTNEEGLGGDDAADALRYLVATQTCRIYQTKLRGL